MTKGVVLFSDDVEVKKDNYCSGRPRDGVKSDVKWQGKTITNPNQPCPKCGETMDVNYIIIMEGGTALAKVINSMEKLGALRKLGHEHAKKIDKLDLFSFMVEWELLLDKYDKLGFEGMFSTHAINVLAVCPHCCVPQGVVTVKLDLTIPEYVPRERTTEQLFESAKRVPKRIQAKIAADLGHPNFESLIKWSAGGDIDRFVELVKGMQTELHELHVPEDISYDFEKYLAKFSMELPAELRAKKQRIVNKVVELAKIEAVGRK